MKKIKVMACIQSLNDGGAQKIIINNLEGLYKDSQIQFEVFVANHVKNSNYEKYLRDKNFTIHYLIGNFLNLIIRVFKKFKIPIDTMKIQKHLWFKAIKTFSPDIIHIHLLEILEIIYEPILKNQVPITLISIHSSPYRYSGEKLDLIKKIFQNKNIIPICLTESQIQEAKEKFNISNYELLRNGIDYQKIKNKIISKNEARELFHLPINSFIITTVGRLEPIKNYSFLLDVFYQLHSQKNNSYLIFAGQGSLMNELKKKATNYGLENNIIFLGNINNVIPLYCAGDVFVLPSISEACPLVLLELQQTNGRAVVSNGIPSEVIVTNKIKKMNKNASIDDWVKAIINEKFIGTKNCDENEYELNYANNKLKEIYLKYWKKYNEQ